MCLDKRSDPCDSKGSSKIPGPGAYGSKSFVGEGPRIAFKPKVETNRKTLSVVPGPGAYQPKHSTIYQNAPAFGLGKGEKKPSESKMLRLIPGPGTYSVFSEKREGPKYGFGKGQRSAQKPTNYPGPGNYPLASSIGSLPAHEKSKCI